MRNLHRVSFIGDTGEDAIEDLRLCLATAFWKELMGEPEKLTLPAFLRHASFASFAMPVHTTGL